MRGQFIFKPLGALLLLEVVVKCIINWNLSQGKEMYCSTSRICHEFLLSWGILELVVEVFWLNTRARGNECICLKCKKDLWRICISIRIPSLPAGDSGRGVKCIDWTLVSGETTPRCDHQQEIRLLPFSKWPLSRRWITVKKRFTLLLCHVFSNLNNDWQNKL